MNLYSNEINFYKYIRNAVSNVLHVPKCYGIVSIDDTNKQHGIILENLFKYEGSFNLDLNQDTPNLLNVVLMVAKLHSIFYFRKQEDVPVNLRNVTTMKDLYFFKELLVERFNIFIIKNKMVLTEKELNIMNQCFQNYEKNVEQVSNFPMSFCHGDLKSANIFYKYGKHNCHTPYFLDWQYIQLNKGVSDIVFLLVESIKFDKMKVELVLNYYYCLISEKIKNYTYEEFMGDFKANICIFPFVVCVWFNSEDSDKLLDKIFPIRFMKNLMEYYEYLLF